MKTKEEMFNAFHGEISKTAIHIQLCRPAYVYVEGKFCSVVPIFDDDRFTVWLHNDLTTKKIDTIIKAVEDITGTPRSGWFIYPPETWIETLSPDQIIQCAKVFGITIHQQTVV